METCARLRKERVSSSSSSSIFAAAQGAAVTSVGSVHLAVALFLRGWFPVNFFASQLHFTVVVRPTCRETVSFLSVLPLAQFHHLDSVSFDVCAPSLFFEQALQDILFRFLLHLDQCFL